MHSVIYRTQLLRDCGLELPKHTFYVDNIFVYQPLPSVKNIYYLDVDLYRYFIGRSDQSVNEKVMVCLLYTSRHGGHLELLPGGSHQFQPDETIYILGENKDVQKFLKN